MCQSEILGDPCWFSELRCEVTECQSRDKDGGGETAVAHGE